MSVFHVSRRDLVLSAAGAYAAFGLTKSIAFIGAAQAQGLPDQGFLKYKSGDLEVTSLSDGISEAVHREGWIRNATVAQTKGALRAAGLSDAFVPVPFTVMAVRTRGRLVLIDSGTGGFPIYGPKAGLLAKSMAAAGLDPKTVKTILVSHLHGDHIYGLMDKDTNAQIFPEAEIIVPAEELKWWTQPGVDALDLGPTRVGLAARIRATLATWKNVRPVAGEAELLPDVHAIKAYGHSPGQMTHLLNSGGKQLLLTADVSLLPALFAKHPDWQGSLDQDPAIAVETRKRIFERAIADKAMIAGTHWIMPNIGTLSKDGNGYAFVPITA
jgi:glyoxylase-like metal-dependent hydrolase (beta-lactamase superfamily II)